MAQGLVSVIIPLYNGEAFIEQALSSVLEQTYPHLEVLVMDDGSTDRSAELVKAFNDHRVRYIRNESNLGLNKNIQKGVTLAEGAYISLLGHDDLYVKDKLEKQVSYLEANGLDGVYAASFILHAQGEVTENLCHVFMQKVADKDPDLIQALYVPDYAVNLPMSQSALFKSHVLKALNPLRDKVRLDDWPVLVKSFETYNMGFINEPMFYWRQHDNNMHKDIWYNLTISVEALCVVTPVALRLKCFANNLGFMSDHFKSRQNHAVALQLSAASFCLNPSRYKWSKACSYFKEYFKIETRLRRKALEKRIKGGFSQAFCS